MIEQGILYIQSVIAEYGAWGVFLAVMVEEFFAPIPSALVPLAAGFFLLPPDAGLAVIGLEALFLVAIPVAIGISIASAVFYGIAYYGGKPVIERTRRYTGLSWREIERIEAKMTRGKRDEITLFALRFIPVVPGFALSGFCGIVRYPFDKFLAITFLGSGLRAFFLALAGWQAGEFYIRYLEVIDRFEKQIFLALLLAVLLFAVLYYAWSKSRRI